VPACFLLNCMQFEIQKWFSDTTPRKLLVTTWKSFVK
jgi:hypothetical protein